MITSTNYKCDYCGKYLVISHEGKLLEHTHWMSVEVDSDRPAE